MLLSAIFMTTLPLALVVIVAFMAIPAALGETAGANAAVKAMEDFRRGCAASTQPCIEVRREGSVVAMGYVLDASDSHLALFDVSLQRGRVLPLDGAELLSGRAPK